MNNTCKYADHVKAWIEKISAPVEGYKICPFARQARYDIEFGSKSYFYKAIHRNLDKLDLLVFIYENSIPINEATKIEKHANSITDNIVMLDHPEDPGFIDGINTGNGKYIIYLIQNKNNLLAARKILLKTDYYNKWSAEYYERIVINSEK